MLVQRLAVEEGLADGDPSAVCLDGTPTRLPITGAYTYFVRDHFRSLAGHAAYRLDLDRRVDGGNSWMLGAWVAHLLLAEGRLAMRDDPADVAVFATGEVAFSAAAERRSEVRAVDRVAEKVQRLVERAQEEAAAGRQVLFVAPRDNAAEARAALSRLPAPARDRIAFHAVAETDEVRALLTTEGAPAGASAPAPDRRPRRRALFTAATSLCLVLATAGAGYLAWQGVERDWETLRQEGRYLDLARSLDAFPFPPLAERFREKLRAEAAAVGALAVSVSARRPADRGSCAGQRFRRVPTVEVPVAADGPLYRLDRQASLCGFTVEAAAAAGQVWILLRLATPADAREAFLPRRRLTAGIPGRNPVRLSQDLPLYRSDSWTWTLAVAWSTAPSEDVARLLAAHGDPAALAALEALGVSVVRAGVVLEP